MWICREHRPRGRHGYLLYPGWPTALALSLVSYKMSLEGSRVSHRRMSLEEVKTGMLGVDRQHARTREVEPGTDPGIFGRERGGRVRRKSVLHAIIKKA